MRDNERKLEIIEGDEFIKKLAKVIFIILFRLCSVEKSQKQIDNYRRIR